MQSFIMLICCTMIAVLSMNLAFGWLSRQARMSLAIAFAVLTSYLTVFMMEEWAIVTEPASKWSVVQSAWRTFSAPSEASQWMALVMLAGVVAAFVSCEWRRPESVANRSTAQTWAARVAYTIIWGSLLVGTLVRLLWGSIYFKREWSTNTAIINISASVLPWVVIILMNSGVVSGVVFRWRSLLIGLSVLGSSLVIGMSGSAVYAMHTMMASLAILVVTLLLAWRSSSGDARLFLPIGMMSLVSASQLWLAHFFAELTLMNLGLLLASFFFAGVVGWSGKRPWPIWLRYVVPITLWMVAVGTPIVLAGLKLRSDLQAGG